MIGQIEVGGSEQFATGVEALLPPELREDINALARTLPGVTATSGGFSVLGVPSDQNRTTLNGVSFSGTSVPSNARTFTSVTTSPFDPSHGGSGGAEVAVTIAPGEMFSTASASISLDAPALQTGGNGADASQYSTLRAGWGRSGMILDNGQHENPYVAIESLGWTNEATGDRGSSTREQMYDWVVNMNGEAYVTAGSSRARLIGQVSPRGTHFVKTVADSTDRDNLLKLPGVRLMPRRSTHAQVGALAGAIAAGYRSRGATSEQQLAETVGGTLGGLAGGLLPDLIEPATTPNHRSVAHSAAVGGTLTLARLAEWRAKCRSVADSAAKRSLLHPVGSVERNSAEWDAVLWRLIAGTVAVDAPNATRHVVGVSTYRRRLINGGKLDAKVLNSIFES